MVLGFSLILLVIILIGGIIWQASRSVQSARAAGHSQTQLHSFGYKQELLRDMGGFSNFAVSFSIISILTGAVTLYGYGFNQGGPGVMGLGWPIVTFFVLFVAAAMAELTSSIPTSGAIYHWAAILGGPTWGWLTAWLNLVGQVTIVAGIDFGCASFTAALLFAQPTKPQTLIVFAIILLSHAVLNHVGIRIIDKLNSISAFYHLIGVLLIIGVLVYFGPKHSVGYIFTTNFSTVTSGSTPYWFAFLLGLLQAQWTLTGYDASAHTSEETLDPQVRAPWGVFLSVAISGIFGYILLALVTMSIKNPLAVAQSGDNAFMTVIQQAVGGTIGQAILWLVTIAMWFCGLSAITSASRIVFAFSRDNGLPFSKLWAKVSPRYHTPAAAIWLVSGIAFLSSLSDNVYAIVTSLSVIGLYSSYFIPIALKIRARLCGAWTTADDGPWNLRKWSMPVNLTACLWIIFLVSLMIISPSTITLTKHLTLHYATGEIFIAVIVLLCLDYYFSARKKFAGPHLGSYEGISVRLQHKSIARLAKLGLDPK